MTAEIGDQKPHTSPLTAEPPVLLILMGASNLSRGGFSLSRHMKTCLHPRRIEVLIASGPGRAYCATGGFLNVSYPPIQSSEIFEIARVKSESGYQVVALVTDIGNDIMYGVSVEKVIETIHQLFNKLQSINAEIFFTTLPMAFEERVHPAWFYILRSMLLPFSRVSYDEAVAGIIEINRFLRKSASEHSHLIHDMDSYLGFDEIHYGWLRAHKAWSHVAGTMLVTLGVEDKKRITLFGMLHSYWEEFRQVVGVDIMGFNKRNPEHL